MDPADRVLDGSQVRLRNVSFHSADGQARQGWWANVDLPSARIEQAGRGDVLSRVGDAVALVTDAGANVLSGPELRVSDREAASRSAYAAAYRAADRALAGRMGGP